MMKMKEKTLTPKQRFDLKIWFVLEKIKKLSFYHLPEQDIEYRIFSPPSLIYENMPFLINEHKVIDFLKKRRAIEIKEPKGRVETAVIPELSELKGRKMAIAFYYVRPKQPKFNSFYREFNIKCKKRMEGLLRSRKSRYRKMIKDKFKKIVKRRKFGRKEKLFLEFLSDLNPHEIKTLAKKISSKSLKHVKQRVQGKLKDTGFSVEATKGYLSNTSFYQLKFAPYPKNI